MGSNPIRSTKRSSSTSRIDSGHSDSVAIIISVMAELSEKKRDKLSTSKFAFPKERKMPLNDAGHVRNALARFNQVEGVSASEKAAAKRRIKTAAKKFGVELGKDPD